MNASSTSILLSERAKSINADPVERVAQHAADQSPLWLLPRVAAFQNLRALWADMRKWLGQDHDRNRQLLGDEVQPTSAKQDDEMQDFSIHLYEDNSKKSDTPVIASTTGGRSKWPLAMAAMFGIPATAAILMAPWIISAIKPSAVVQQPTPIAIDDEYVPILLPGRPAGVR